MTAVHLSVSQSCCTRQPFPLMIRATGMQCSEFTDRSCGYCGHMNPQAARSWTRHTASEQTAHVGYASYDYKMACCLVLVGLFVYSSCSQFCSIRRKIQPAPPLLASWPPQPVALSGQNNQAIG